MLRLVTYLIFLLLPGVSILGSQSETVSPGVSDSTELVVDSQLIVMDSVIVTDSVIVGDTVGTVLAASIEDSILLVNPDIILDTLNQAQRMLVEFETRYTLRMRGERRVEVQTELSYFDSLVTYFVSPRWDLREDIDRSFYHDAGDYFRSDPGFFTLEHQVTPMRKTIQPYGLAGDRLAIFSKRQQLLPFEHIVEPDGLMDLNDIPTALDHQVAILPGPVGWLFGGRQAAATLITRPKQLSETEPETSFLVDKGTFGYAYTRGRYSKQFASGKTVDLSVGNRSATGDGVGFRDDAVKQSRADFYFPLGKNYSLKTGGWLYDSEGSLFVRPDMGGRPVTRNRFNRLGKFSIARQNESLTAKYELALTHIAQSSSLGRNYVGRIERTGNTLSLSREWSMGGVMARGEIDGARSEYDNHHDKYQRTEGGAALSIARLTGPFRIAVNLRTRYVEDYKFLPAASFMVSRDSEKSYLMLSAGYSERAPSMHELHLRPQSGTIYGISINDYADRGNPELGSERMIIGSAQIELGSLASNIGVAATGGKIIDGIDWQNIQNGNQTLFSPINGDVNFATVTASTRYRLANYVHFKGGGSYHYLDYENFADKAYAPELQAFSGTELHLFWSQKLIDLYAYGEMVYVGRYHGYAKPDLGERLVFNAKLSFRMSSFRFHWVIQNSFSEVYDSREDFSFPGQYNYYGFTWDFIN